MNRKLLLTYYNDICLAVIVEDGNIVEIHPESVCAGPRVGETYMGTVKKVVASQNVAYLDIGFADPVYMNLGKRNTEEKVCPGMQFSVQVKKEATGLKKAVVTECSFEENRKIPFGAFYAKDADEIVTDSEEIYQEFTEFGIQNIRYYSDEKIGLSRLYGIPSCIESIFQKRVWLKCGGFLVIEPTEALTVIDVNSGKYIHGKDKEAAIFKVNLEAAKEIAFQLRLRNLSGIILIDFINMKDKDKKQFFLQVLKEELKKDPVTVQYIDETGLQLVELTRKRTEPPVYESLKKHNISFKREHV